MFCHVHGGVGRRSGKRSGVHVGGRPLHLKLFKVSCFLVLCFVFLFLCSYSIWQKKLPRVQNP
jgi:hypothetical protein